MNNNENINQIQNDEIDLKEVFKTIFRYKYSILVITLFFMILSVIFAQVKQNIYTASSTIQIMEESNKSTSQADFMLQALEGSSANLDNEIEVIKSRFLAQKAFTYLNLKTRYFTTNKFRKVELYKNSPFIVRSSFIDNMVYNKEFILTPIDKETFNLKIKPISMFSPKGFLKNIGILSMEPSEKIEYSKYTFSFMRNIDLYEFYKENITVSQISKNATILKLDFQDTSSLRAKEILDAIHKAYTNQEIEQKTKEANLTLNFIERQLMSISNRLKKSETKLENFKEKNQVVGLNQQAIQTTEQLSSYEAKLEVIQTELNILTNLNQYIRTNQDLMGLTIGSVNFADPALASLVTRLQEEATKKATLLVDFTAMHPNVEKANKNIIRLKRSIQLALSNNIRQLTSRKTSMEKIIGKFNKSIALLPRQEKELSRLTRFFGIDERIYTFLLEKKAETAILQSSTISNTRLLDGAIEIEEPIKPKRTLIVLVGIILGLIMGLAWAFLREFMNNTVKNSDEIEKLSSIPLYGIIPENTKKTQNLVDESYRAIRTNLQFLPNHESSQVISITSSVSGEGKTTVSANLGRILGQANKKVIVLDIVED